MIVRSGLLERKSQELLYPLNYREHEIVHVSFRLLSFLVNGYLIRLVSQEVLGVVFVRLTLLYTTTLFLAREPLRKVCLTEHSQQKWPKLVSMIWLSVPFSLVLSVLLTSIWVLALERPALPYYTLGCVVFGLCGIVELAAEPAHIYLMNNLVVRAPIWVEAISHFSQTLFILCFAHYSRSLLPFILGAVLYSLLYVLVYWLLYYRYRKSPQDKLIYKDFTTSPEYVSLAVSFLKQSVLKQILTEGEGFVMTLFPLLSFAQQGVFSTISRLASIVMRVGFRNIEDSYYHFFVQMLRRGLPIEQQGADAVKTCQESLGNLLRFMTLFGVIITVFGLSYSWLALLLYGGDNLANTEAPFLLQLYCPYIYVCGVNGIAECFFFATMAQVEIERYNYKLMLFSACFLALSVGLSYCLGTAGFILANVANMLIRIFFSFSYITKFYKSSDVLYRMVPNIPQVMVIAVCGVTALLSKLVLESRECLLGYLLHLLIGGLCCVGCLLFTWECEDSSFKYFLRSLLPLPARFRTKTD